MPKRTIPPNFRSPSPEGKPPQPADPSDTTDEDSPPPVDFRPSADWAMLRRWDALLRQTRDFFRQRGFLEVQTPLLSAETVVDRHLDPFPVPLEPRPGSPAAWLQTSPELCMKRLLATDGAPPAIYQITRAFRQGEFGPLHNPEFTLAEWYRSGDDMQQGMQLLAELAEVLLGCGPVEQVSYRRAFQQYAGVDPIAADTAALAAAAEAAGVAGPEGLAADDRDTWLDLLLVERVAPALGQERPLILYDYPASQAMLARVRDGEVPVAERFELFFRGVELANGYHELRDPEALRNRVDEANRARRTDGKLPLPMPERLLAAMESGLPDCAGVAIGLDRVLMLAAGKSTLGEVMPFPLDRA
jgi:lysyl-tRNA synthetase class 2